MRKARWAACCVAFVVLPAFGQYPPRGQPDPAFNGGRPRVVAVTPAATGFDRGEAIVALSATRFAILGFRPLEDYDFVAIVDTAPENVVTFDAIVATPTEIQALLTIAAAGTKLVLGGTVLDPDGALHATLEVREIGVAASPSFASAGALVTPSADPARPRSQTDAVAARATDAGTLEIWQARNDFIVNFGCSTATLVRVDHAAGALTPRHRLDLSAALGQPCMAALYAILHATPADAVGTTAILIGASCRAGSNELVHACLVRVLDNGTSLVIDRSFGSNGIARYGAGGSSNILLRGVHIDGARRIVVLADRQSASGQQVTGLVFRLNANGALDTTFGSGGTASIATAGNSVSGGAITPHGVIQVVGSVPGGAGTRPFIDYLDPATGALLQHTVVDFLPTEPAYLDADFAAVAPLPAGGALAVGGATTGASVGHTLVARLAGDRQTLALLEYYHAAFDHYFVTGLADEIRKLDDGTFAGWQRTGESFAALPIEAAASIGFCRFFSTTFGLRSSHFYTARGQECDDLKTGNVWQYEGDVFALIGLTPSLACPPGTSPLFRLYNDGQGGAPNHRLTVSERIRTAQVAQRWVGEGLGSPPVFACVPR